MNREFSMEILQEIVPVENYVLYISCMFYRYVKLLVESENAGNIKNKLIRAVESRIQHTGQIMASYSNAEIPEAMVELNERFLDAFTLYYEGLLLFQDFLDGKRDRQLKDAFDYFYEGDKILQEVEAGLEADGGSFQVMI